MSDIEERIVKLLRLSQNEGATQAEAETALRAAIRLAESNRVDLDQLRAQATAAGRPDVVTHKRIKCNLGIGKAELNALAFVQTHFPVHVVTVRGGCPPPEAFIAGTHSDVTIAAHVFIYLSRIMRGAWTIARAKDKRLKQAAFMRGMLVGIHAAMGPKSPGTDQTAIVLDLKSYVDRELGPTTSRSIYKKPVRASRSYSEGYHKGRQVRIHDTLEGDPTRPAQLPA